MGEIGAWNRNSEGLGDLPMLSDEEGNPEQSLGNLIFNNTAVRHSGRSWSPSCLRGLRGAGSPTCSGSAAESSSQYLMAVRICGSTPPRISTGAGFCLVTHLSREGTKAEPGTAAHEAAATSVN